MYHQPDLTPTSIKTGIREAAMCFLSRLCVDRTVVEDGEVQLCLGEAISNLVQSFSELQYRDSVRFIRVSIRCSYLSSFDVLEKMSSRQLDMSH